MTTEEAANYLGVATRTLCNWRNTGRVDIPYLKLGRKKVLYLIEDLDSFLESSHGLHRS
ncbi:helix-turn-helix domain-containing protein [Escherichia coli]|nr:helix-turn-helix domain-containing protein [Escherichia coli]